MNLAKRIMLDANLILPGHYVLNSGLHAPLYVNKDLASCDPDKLDVLAFMMAIQIASMEGPKPNVVVGAMEGSAVLANRVAGHLSHIYGWKVQAVWASKKDDGFVFRSTYANIIKDRCLCVQVEDIMTTGKAALQVRSCILEVGGQVLGVDCLWNRGVQTAESLGFPWLAALVSEQVESNPYPCLECLAGVPINTDLGHGKKFLAEHPEYPKI